MPNPLSSQLAALADQGIRWVAITWVNHAGAPLVKVVPLACFEAAAALSAGNAWWPLVGGVGWD